jgi:hypothetical protein
MAESMAMQTMFDSLAISVPKDGSKKDAGVKGVNFDKYNLLSWYENRFELVFDYVFLSVRSHSPPFPSLSLPILWFLSLHSLSPPAPHANTTQAGLALAFMAIIAFVALPEAATGASTSVWHSTPFAVSRSA